MISDMTQQFRDWLAAQIGKRDTSVRRIGDQSGIHPTTIGRWLAGETEPDARNVELLAKYFQVDQRVVYELLGRVESTTLAQLTAEELMWVKLYREASSDEREQLRNIVDAARRPRGKQEKAG